MRIGWLISAMDGSVTCILTNFEKK